jgi:hypothetical protein
MAQKIVKNIAGIAMPIAIVVGLAVLLMGLFLSLPHGAPTKALSATATTTVTVLNTPPQWQVDAQEYIESSTSSPTNAGSNVVWVGTANDSNGENYYLAICKTSSTPSANPNAPPTCAGGNVWAVSTGTVNLVQATSTYASIPADAEANDWYAFICDGNSASPQCNSEYKQGTGNTASPFVINHRPNFSAISNDSPKDPGAVLTWTATASDTDAYGGQDNVRLWVCQAADFSAGSCGGGGTYCSSSLAATNPTCNYTITIPTKDTTYNSYPYVVDEHVFAASGGSQAATTTYTVNNVRPTISSSSISLLDTDSIGPLTLTAPNATTSGFKARFTVTDNNSCASNEVASVAASVYRSAAACSSTSDYNPNRCYPTGLALSEWNVSSAASSTSCTGLTDSTVIWDFTFPLWYITDPTDGSSTNTVFWDQEWTASVSATDDNGTSSPITVAASGNEVNSFLAFDVVQSSIPYGSLSPGSTTNPIVATTTTRATGNVGLDQLLSGTSMCTTYPTCPVSTTSTIPVTEQVYATSSVSYSTGTPLTASSTEIELNVLKSTATSTPQSKAVFWGTRVPVSITLAGDYTGQDTIIAVTGEPSQW